MVNRPAVGSTERDKASTLPKCVNIGRTNSREHTEETIVSVIDTSKYDEMTAVMAGIAHRHRARQHGEESEALYYELMAQYFRRVQEALRDGKPVVALSSMVPHEVLYAMDIVPMQLEHAATGTVATLKVQEEVLAVAGELGWGTSLCSSHRAQAALIVRGWLPRPTAVIWSHHTCDANAKSGQIVKDLYGVPGFFLDRPFDLRDSDRHYYALELRDMVGFLERLTNRRMDWDRFGRILENAFRMFRLWQEILRLRAAVPCPMSNRQGMQLTAIHSVYGGTGEGVKFFEAVKGELQARVENGLGSTSQEKYRLLGLFSPPTYGLKLLEWMEREHGAAVAAEPLFHHWGQWELDPARPLETLAAKCFASPNSRQLHGPAHRAVIHDVVEDALDCGAEGAIFWANDTCAHCGGLIRLLTDALREKAGIPTLVLHMDLLDPSGASHEDMKGQIEAFLQRLDGKKTAGMAAAARLHR